MLKSILRWSLVLLCLFVVGPASAAVVGRLQDVDGGQAASLLVGASPARGAFAGAILFVAAGLVGAVGAHFYSLGTGFACSGLVVAWGAWSTGDVEHIVRRAGGSADVPGLAVEGGLAMLATACITLILWLIARRKQPRRSGTPGSANSRLWLHLVEVDKAQAPFPAFAAGLVACAVGAAGAAWIISVSPLKGQTIFAAFVGGIVSGVAAQLATSGLRAAPTPVLPVCAMILPAAAGPLTALLLGSSALYAASGAGTMPPLSLIMGLDWSAGALLGVPVGLGWAGAMIDHRALPES